LWSWQLTFEWVEPYPSSPTFNHDVDKEKFPFF
jgi:hypothetical protein